MSSAAEEKPVLLLRTYQQQDSWRKVCQAAQRYLITAISYLEYLVHDFSVICWDWLVVSEFWHLLAPETQEPESFGSIQLLIWNEVKLPLQLFQAEELGDIGFAAGGHLRRRENAEFQTPGGFQWGEPALSVWDGSLTGIESETGYVPPFSETQSTSTCDGNQEDVIKSLSSYKKYHQYFAKEIEMIRCIFGMYVP